jgi:chemotaxis protein MotB
MPRRRVQEEHQNHEAWAIPYGDLLTLLLAFFVVMYAISSVNSGKYRVLSDALTAAFRGEPRMPQPMALGAAQQGISEYLPITEVNRMFTAGMPDYMRMPLPRARGTEREGAPLPGSSDPRATSRSVAMSYAQAREAELTRIQGSIGGALAPLMRNDLVRIARRGNDIEAQISSDILFGSGVAQLGPSAQTVLSGLADALKPWPNAIRVEGHTDDRPINTSLFRSNWELSAARAASVVRLMAERGVAPQRLAVAGFGEYRPVTSNASAVGRNTNRRVVIVIQGSDADGSSAPTAAPAS